MRRRVRRNQKKTKSDKSVSYGGVWSLELVCFRSALPLNSTTILASGRLKTMFHSTIESILFENS